MSRVRTLVMVWAMCFGASGGTEAAIPVPSGLSPGAPYHLIFASSVANDADFTGIAGADLFVQARADAAFVGVTEGVSWQALLSDHFTNANQFNPIGVPIYNMQGQRVAVDGPALWNAATIPLENAVRYDETGALLTGILIEVWTGTNPVGTFDRADSDWLASPTDMFATAGSAIDVSGNWMIGGAQPSENVPLSVYAVSEQLFAAAVPEPSTFVLGILGLLGMVGQRRCRRR